MRKGNGNLLNGKVSKPKNRTEEGSRTSKKKLAGMPGKKKKQCTHGVLYRVSSGRGGREIRTWRENIKKRRVARLEKEV